MLDLQRFNEVVILTGAGISVASGLGTYRGPGGLWEDSGVAEAATKEGFEADPWSIWRFFNPLLEQIVEAHPNPAHLALAEIEKRHRGKLTLVTQNVDGLHRRAGSHGVLELHGNLRRRRCSRPKCLLKPFEETVPPTELPLCPLCDHPIRPDIVLFGEAISVDAGHESKRALRTVDLFLAIGTSQTVQPASNFVRAAQYAGALTVEFNLQGSGQFEQEILGPAEETVPMLLAQF
jgi:NAD-dependent protein deacetylase/lipoamidase